MHSCLHRIHCALRQVPIKHDVEPLHLLLDEATLAEWHNCHLPADKFSAENAAIVTQCARWPLLIDPQLQGLKWLKTVEQKRAQATGAHVYSVQLGDKGWIRKVGL